MDMNKANMTELAIACFERAHLMLNSAMARWLEEKTNDQQFGQECCDIANWLIKHIGRRAGQ